jgi:hypothetical protein
LLKRCAGFALVVGGRERIVGVDEVKPVMGHPCTLRGGDLGSADVQAAIDLARVCADDLRPRDALRQVERQRRLASRRRPADDDQRRKLRLSRRASLTTRTDRCARRER